jgi:hypothetical protein
MRVRINIDFEISPRVKRALKIGACAAIVLGASVAYAAVPNTFTDGDALSAQKMNDNFTSLDTRLTKLEAPPVTLEQQSTSALVGTLGAPLVYTNAKITLTPGTWLIEASTTVFTTSNGDSVALSLYDATAGADVPSSAGPINQGAGVGLSFPLTTSKIMTVAANTDIEMKASPNGSSTINFNFTGNLTAAHRLSAVRLR